MPSVPPAPVRFSTTICWPIERDMTSPTARAIKSIAPPGASGTMKRTGRFGHGVSAAPPWARAARTAGSARPAVAADAKNSRRPIILLIVFLPEFFLINHSMNQIAQEPLVVRSLRSPSTETGAR